jgi:hypothetical protein
MKNITEHTENAVLLKWIMKNETSALTPDDS